MRTMAVLLVAWSLLIPIRRLGIGNKEFELLLLAALLIPGASESLIRAANDVAVFAWAAGFLYLMDRLPPTSQWKIALVSTIGPLLKLTALPIVAYVALKEWKDGRRRTALLILACSAVVFPLQRARGWMWGGTLEANSAAPISDSLGTIVAGVAKSFVTLMKTAIWLGGWSGFRAPVWLLVSFCLAILCVVWRCFRKLPTARSWVPHLAATLVAVLGIIVFALGHRKVFGVWGAVGGWYAWGWVPWLALAIGELVEFRRDRLLELAWSLALTIGALNVAWYSLAFKNYG